MYFGFGGVFFRPAGLCSKIASFRILLRSLVLITNFLVSLISVASSKSLVTFSPVLLEVSRTGAKGRKF